ncbi:MAG: MYG1 family protein, partial [Patescibacteria group bacterium]
HTDDVFAVATIFLVVGEAEVVRSRDQEVHKTADYVVDTGMEYNPSARHFDHHQPGGAGERENGIPYASFGLVWKEYGKKLAGGEKEAALIDRELVQPIDAHDNGVPIAEYKFKGVRDYAIGDFFSSFIESRDSDHLYTVFMHVAGIAKDLLKREISMAKKTIIQQEKILAFYDASLDRRLVIMPEEMTGWREVLGQTKEALYAVYPRPDGSWSLKCVPDFSKSYYGALRKPLPLEWAGKDGEEFQQMTGVQDAIFTHKNLFTAGARTKEGVLKLAEIALNA